MNSIHRLGIAISGVVAALTVGIALMAGGYVSPPRTAAHEATLAQESASMAPTPSPTATVTPETIYIEADPTTPVVKVVRPAPPVDQPAPTTAPAPARPAPTPNPTPRRTRAPAPSQSNGWGQGGIDD